MPHPVVDFPETYREVPLPRLLGMFLELKAEPQGGPIWLHTRGPKGTVEFLTTTFRRCGLSV